MEPGKKKSKKKLIIAIILIAVAVVVIGALCVITGILNKVNRVSKDEVQERIPRSQETFEITTDEPDTIKKEEVEELFDVDKIDMMKVDEIKNILLIGQDAREGEERQRSDTMIICSINTKEDKVTLVSLMRDMYVPIPGYSNNRINAAYAFGGMSLLDEVIEEDFGIPIDGNVEVDFEGFVSAMEVIDGIDIELTAEEAGYLSAGGWEDQGENANDGTWELHEGMNTLTPPQALAFSRIRMIGNSDWERTERQRRVLMAAFDKLSSSSTAKLLSVADKILPYITTDLTNSELLSYVKTLSVAGITEIDSYRLPVDGHYSSESISGMSVLVPDLVENSELLKQYIYGEEVDEDLEKEIEKNHKAREKDKEDEDKDTTVTPKPSASRSSGTTNYQNSGAPVYNNYNYSNSGNNNSGNNNGGNAGGSGGGGSSAPQPTEAPADTDSVPAEGQEEPAAPDQSEPAGDDSAPADQGGTDVVPDAGGGAEPAALRRDRGRGGSDRGS